MDLSAKKKRNTDAIIISTEPLLQTNDDAKKIISYFTLEQLQSIIANAIVDPSSVLPYVRAVADKDPSQRKLFIRGLGEETTNESLHSLFSSFGELQGACAICDKSTGKCKGYGFVSFQHIDGAILALQEPMKKIDGRMAVAQLATAADVSLRKVYVGNVPRQMPRDRLLQLFSSFGEIEETWGVDEQTGKFKGYALFVYKSAEAARAAIEEPMKIVDGHHMIVELAIDGKKKPGMVVNSSVVENKVGDGGIAGFRTQNSIPGSMGNQYGAAAAAAAAAAGGGGGGGSVMGHYAFGSGGHHHLNPPLQSSIGLGLSGRTPNLIDGSMGLMAVSGIGGYGSGGGVEGARTTAIKEAQDLSMISFAAAAAAAAAGGGRGMGLYGLGSGGSGGHHHLNSPLQSSIGLGLSGQAPNSVGGSMGLTAASGIGGYGTGGFGGPKRTVREEAITFADVAAGVGGSRMGFYELKLGGHHHGLELSHQASSSIGGSMAASGIGGYGSGGGFGGAQMKARDPSTITFGDVAAGGGSGMGLYGLGSGGHHHLYSPLQSSIGLGLSGQAPNSIGGSTGLLTGSGIGGYGSGGVFGGAKTTVMDEAQDLSFDERMGKMMAHEVYTKYRTRDDEPIKKKGIAFTAQSDSETSEEVSENEAAFLSNEFRKFLRKNRFSKKRSRNEKDKEDGEEQDPIKCFRCNKSGHIKRDCPLLKDSSSNQKKEKKFKKIKEDSEEEDPMRCFKCNEPGHIKRDCPLLKDSSSNQKEEKKFKKCKDEEDSEEEDPIKCFRCNEFGHKRRDCPLRKDSSSISNQKEKKKFKKQEDTMRCHRCREYGHLLKNCPLWDDSKNEKDKQDGKDSEEEDLRRCFNCNEFGHVKRNCPLWKDSSFNPKKNKKYESEGVEL